jgi:hypothetical protein
MGRLMVESAGRLPTILLHLVFGPLKTTASKPRCRHIRSRYPSESSNVGGSTTKFAEGQARPVRDASAARGRAMDHVHQNGAFGPVVARAGAV